MTAYDKDYYAIMQVDELAESVVIAAAYKALAAKYHPDRNPSPTATRLMQAINEAYAVLSDPQKRAEYDRQRPRWRNGGANGFGTGIPDARPRERFERLAQRIRELQEHALQQIQAIQERSAQQIRDIQERAAQQVKAIQDQTAQQIREIQQRTAEQIRNLQENL
jgi:DnaJ-class molecular chaperone